MRRNSVVITLLPRIAIISGCRSSYYTVWETLGKEKRHLLKDQVEKARDEQEGDLEDLYIILRNNYASLGRRSR